jgi:hypothetical protein
MIRVRVGAIRGNASSATVARAAHGEPGVRRRCARLVGMGRRDLDRVRRIALAMPEVNERLSHGAPCFFIRDKRPVCYFHDHHRVVIAGSRFGVRRRLACKRNW